MSGADDRTAFERRLAALLERDADTTSGHVRSRLTQARHAALAEAAQRPGWLRRGLVARRVWMPAAGALVAAVVLVMLLGPRRAAPAPPFTANTGALAVEDVSLLSDRDGLALVQDGDGQFYEWAAAQARPEPQAGAEGVESNENGG